MDKRNISDRSILSFSQDSGFYLRTGRRQAEAGNYISALNKLRKAYEIDPNSIENVLSFAELLNRMQRFEESARVLLLYASPDAMPADALFGLASDFLGMEEFIPAKQCLSLYLHKYPTGQFAANCNDYLALFADKEEFAWQLGLDEGENIELITHIHYSKAMHYSYLDKECLNYLKSLETRFPESLWLQMEIALAEFFLNMRKDAEYRAINILKKDSEYVRAKCLLSYIRLSNNKKLEAIDILNSIHIPADPDLESLGMLSSVLLEAGLYEKAEKCTNVLLSFLPYDPLTIHQAAYAKYMTGKPSLALELYRSILEMDPHDTVASYYINWISSHPSPFEATKGFMTSYDVSYGEAIRRLNSMGTYFNDGIKKAAERWKTDQTMRDLFAWSLNSPFIQAKKSVFYALTALRDHYATQLLKNYLLKIDQPDDEKQRAFTALQLMDVSEPLSLYFRGSWQFCVSCAPAPETIPSSYKRIRERLEGLVNTAKYQPDTINIALHYYDFYIQALKRNYPRINKFQREATVAALIYIALETQQYPISPDKIAVDFKVSLKRLHNAIDRLLYFLSDDQNDSGEE